MDAVPVLPYTLVSSVGPNRERRPKVLSSEPYTAEQTMHRRLEERRQGFARRRRSRSDARPEGLLAWQARWLLCELGYRLAALGAHLEAYAPPPDQPR
jgi:hypothetical protein